MFFLGISMLCACPCAADLLDIPLFSDPPASSSEKKSSSDTLVLAPKSEEEKTSKTAPDIGRHASPREEIILTPPPLPEVSIDLRDKVPEPVIESEPQAPINMRQEEINIPPPDKTEGAPTQPVKRTDLHDVRQFEVEGFYLGMLLKEVLQVAQQKGYTVSKVKKTLPLFQTTHYETLCRQQGIYVPEKIRACIRMYGQQNKQDYVEELLLTKTATHEAFHFKLTSPATGNEVYQITYQNKGDNSLNFAPANLAKKLSRREAFFNAVFAMYGYPDDDKELIWGAKEDAYMQVSMIGSAYDATIRLVDMNLSNEDYFAAKDWQADQKELYHFGFAE